MNNINCPSCGAANQLPESKTSMFCAFCGSSIQTIELDKEKKSESFIKSKPEISSYGSLDLEERNINSLLEIISWFSNNELGKIKNLNLKGNNISSLEGLDKFYLADSINFDENNFTNLSENDIKILNNLNIECCSNNVCGYRIFLRKNEFKSYEWIDKINLEKILRTYKGEIAFTHDYKMYRKDIYNCFEFAIYCDSKTLSMKHPLGIDVIAKLEKESKSGCFIATATMGSYEHPTVMELRYFRDDWILQKSWGEVLVKWYYHYGAIAAKIIEKSFVLKKISYLFIVKPLVYLSRIVKK
nr:CFI-box-CTERM domain-containing protein [uncultured Flavobacterium sp.]